MRNNMIIETTIPDCLYCEHDEVYTKEISRLENKIDAALKVLHEEFLQYSENQRPNPHTWQVFSSVVEILEGKRE
jgi:hypothetical protein